MIFFFNELFFFFFIFHFLIILFSLDTDAVPSPQKSECSSKQRIQLLLIQTKTDSLIAFILFLFLPGEMHDIFVGLMGRRNTESGECDIGILFLIKKKKTKKKHCLWIKQNLGFEVQFVFGWSCSVLSSYAQIMAPGGESIPRGGAFFSTSAG